MVSRGIAAPYAHERFAGHRAGLARALRADGPDQARALRNLAVDAARGALLSA